MIIHKDVLFRHIMNFCPIRSLSRCDKGVLTSKWNKRIFTGNLLFKPCLLVKSTPLPLLQGTTSRLRVTVSEYLCVTVYILWDGT